jgi:hypothetical protein
MGRRRRRQEQEPGQHEEHDCDSCGDQEAWEGPDGLRNAPAEEPAGETVSKRQCDQRTDPARRHPDCLRVTMQALDLWRSQPNEYGY